MPVEKTTLVPLPKTPKTVEGWLRYFQKQNGDKLYALPTTLSKHAAHPRFMAQFTEDNTKYRKWHKHDVYISSGVDYFANYGNYWFIAGIVGFQDGKTEPFLSSHIQKWIYWDSIPCQKKEDETICTVIAVDAKTGKEIWAGDCYKYDSDYPFGAFDIWVVWKIIKGKKVRALCLPTEFLTTLHRVEHNWPNPYPEHLAFDPKKKHLCAKCKQILNS